MKIRITTLSENTANYGFLAEWGLSILVEVDRLRILVDTGLSFSAVHNAQLTGIDLSKIDRMVLSHGHADHTGGLREVLKIKGKLASNDDYTLKIEDFETKEKIMDNINVRLPDVIDKVKLEVKKRPREVECPEHLLRQLRQIEENLALHSGSLPYRHQIQLNAMTEALAVMRNHATVTQEDIETISHLSNWINYDFNSL